MKNIRRSYSTLAESQAEIRTDIKPFATSLSIAVSVVLFSVVYIVVSGNIVLEMSKETALSLHRMESIKGIIYVTLNGFLIFFILYFLLGKIKTSSQIIMEGRRHLAAKEKQIVAGIMAASIAHDINNLNQVIVGNMYIMEENLGGSMKKETDKIMETCGRIASLTRKLSDAARNSYSEVFEKTDMSAIVRENVSFASTSRAVKNCRITEDYAGKIEAEINTQLFGRIVLNLILNAAEAVSGKGDILVRLYRNLGNVTFEVHDSGPGIAPEKRETVFDPFYTTKKGGSGLGLISTRLFSQEHDGSVFVTDSAELGGACFRITFPDRALRS